MQLPEIIEERLGSDASLSKMVHEVLTTTLPVLQGRGMPFFPEYTEHGDVHAGQVLDTACSLMNDAALSQFSPLDAALLTIAGLSHDLAMHLTEDGFLRLVHGPVRPSVRQHDPPWRVLWDRFYSEVQRYDSRQLIALFGERPEPVRVPPDDPLAFTGRDRLLIGEFVRRWHHRMAHEFLLGGMPGKDGGLPLVEVDERIVNLAGLVARSHGMPVRELLPDLREHYSLRTWRGAHPVFLMVLLRIADYMHIGPNRAPGALLQVRALRSPVSQREWAVNQAVDDIRQAHEDPEAIEVDSYPESIGVYRRMKGWLHAFQSELDASWAVLGETYGRYVPQNQLGIVVRRVRSNLDDVDAFEKRAAFVPRVAKFEAAGTDLLKLLVKPLYGNRPQFAIRELVQNAVDAVRERRAWGAPVTEDEPPPLLDETDADVLVSIDPGEGDEIIVSVVDRGIGMVHDTVCDYFLKIGASFRQSEAWRTHFEQAEGKSVVLRSGRFGIGVLAAFILGDEIEVTTRHVSTPPHRAVTFRSRIDQEEVDLRWTTAPVGTAIRVRVTLEMAERLVDSDWDWYCLDDPRVVRRVGPTLLNQAYILPTPADTPLPRWRQLHPPGFESVLWSDTAEAPLLACNGFRVINRRQLPWRMAADSLRLQMPSVSVFDPDGHLPLTILRNELGEPSYPFEEELFEGVLLDLLAHIVARGPASPVQSRNMAQYLTPSHKGVISSGERSLYVAAQQGFVLFESELLEALRLDRIILSTALGRGPIADRVMPASIPHMFQYLAEEHAESWLRIIEALVRPALERFSGVRVITSESDQEHAPRLFFGSKEFGNIISLEGRAQGISIWRAGECPERDELVSLLSSHASWIRDYEEKERTRRYRSPQRHQLMGVYSVMYGPRASQRNRSPLGELWMRTLGAQVVPYALTERKALMDAKLPGMYDRYGMRPRNWSEEDDTEDIPSALHHRGNDRDG